jgi:hypothetical protein
MSSPSTLGSFSDGSFAADLEDFGAPRGLVDADIAGPSAGARAAVAKDADKDGAA